MQVIRLARKLPTGDVQAIKKAADGGDDSLDEDDTRSMPSISWLFVDDSWCVCVACAEWFSQIQSDVHAVHLQAEWFCGFCSDSEESVVMLN